MGTKKEPLGEAALSYGRMNANASVSPNVWISLTVKVHPG